MPLATRGADMTEKRPPGRKADADAGRQRLPGTGFAFRPLRR